MGNKKGKPNRKDDTKKAISHYEQYLEHQDKINSAPDSLAVTHWRKEKRNFLTRAKVNFDDVIK
ncbi:MAG TPA: hypothetical protein VKK79_03795 [Candidatus Lokiarchaeia archaeon]|nr:hypothetical protein [Candidatus Lokiarchaeia archaeon]